MHGSTGALMRSITDACADAVSFAVEKSADLHQIAVALHVVVDHRRLHQKRVVAVHHQVDSLLRLLDKHRLLLAFHERPHSLVRRQLGLL